MHRGWLAAALALGVVVGALGARLTATAPGWPSYADAFDAVAPSVVNVGVGGPEGRVGTGFAVGPDEVVTARHLVLGADEVVIRDVAGQHLTGRVVGTDARSDLALLRVEGGALPPARLGSSAGVRVGDTVLAIGNPYGLGHTLSVGVVGQRARRLADAVEGPRVAFLQLSAPLNPGNSGGPVFAEDGTVVAVLSGTHSHGQAIAFAVPVEALLESLPLLRAGEQVSRAFLGLGTTLDGDVLRIATVTPGGPADQAGLRVGDGLTAFDGAPVASPAELQARLDARRGGQRVSVRLLRDGAVQLVDVTLADWAAQPVVAGGMTLRPSAGAGGAVVAVRPRSRAENAGIRVGDVIRAVDGAPVQAPVDVKGALEGGQAVQLEVLRDGMALALTLEEMR